MEITYDDIIKYLVPNSKKKFANNNNTSICLSSETYFKNILNDQFCRIGVLQNNFQNLNISFFVSFLTLTIKTFQQTTNEEKMNMVKQFKLFINEQILELNLGSKRINLDIIDNDIIQLFSQIFDINILIFDFKNEDIFIAFTGDTCDIFKPFVLLSNFDQEYEPILYKTNKIVSFNDEYFKNILKSASIKYLNNINKTYSINDDINNIIQELNNNNKLINQTFIKDTDIPIETPKLENGLTLIQLNKLKKDELIDILKNQGMDINKNTKLLKKDLIKLIK